MFTTSSANLDVATDGHLRPTGLRVEGHDSGAGPGAEISARRLEPYMALDAVADGDGDARATVGELTRHRDWLHDVLLGR